MIRCPNKILTIIMIEILCCSQISWAVAGQVFDLFGTDTQGVQMSVSQGGIPSVDFPLMLASGERVPPITTVGEILRDLGVEINNIPAAVMNVMNKQVTQMSYNQLDGESGSLNLIWQDGYLIVRSNGSGGFEARAIVERKFFSEFKNSFTEDDFNEVLAVNKISDSEQVMRIYDLSTGASYYFYIREYDANGETVRREIPLITKEFLVRAASKECEEVKQLLMEIDQDIAEEITAINSRLKDLEVTVRIDATTYKGPLQDIRKLFADFLTSLGSITQSYSTTSLRELSANYLKAKLQLHKGRSLVNFSLTDLFIQEPETLSREDKIIAINRLISSYPIFSGSIAALVETLIDPVFRDRIESIATSGTEYSYKEYSELRRKLLHIFALCNTLIFPCLPNNYDSQYLFMLAQSSQPSSSCSLEKSGLKDYFKNDNLSLLAYSSEEFIRGSEFSSLRNCFIQANIFLSAVEDWLVRRGDVASKDLLLLLKELSKATHAGTDPLDSYKTFDDAQLNVIYRDLRKYFEDESYKEYENPISQLSSVWSDYSKAITALERRIDELERGTLTNFRPGELLEGIGDLSEITNQLLSSKQFLDSVLSIDKYIRYQLNRPESVIGAAGIEFANFFLTYSILSIWLKPLPRVRDIKDNLNNYLSRLRDAVKSLFNYGILKRDGTEKTIIPLIESIVDRLDSLEGAFLNQGLASMAFSEAVQFALLSLASGFLGAAIRNTSFFQKVSAGFQAWKTGTMLAKSAYFLGRYVIGGAIAVLNQIDARGQELTLSILGKPGAWLGSVLFPGSKLGALVTRIGLNTLVVGLSSGFAQGLPEGSLGRDIAAGFRNPLIVLSKIADGKVSWVNNIIEPFGIPLPDIAEFLHLVFFSRDGWPFSMVRHSVVTLRSPDVPSSTTYMTTEEALTSLKLYSIPLPLSSYLYTIVEARKVPAVTPTVTTVVTHQDGTDSVTYAGTYEDGTDSVTYAGTYQDGTDSVTYAGTYQDGTNSVTHAGTYQDGTARVTVTGGGRVVVDPVAQVLDSLGGSTAVTSVIPIENYEDPDLQKAVSDVVNDPMNKNVEGLQAAKGSILQMLKSVRDDPDSFWGKIYREAQTTMGMTPHVYQLIAAFLITEGYQIRELKPAGEDSRLFFNIFTGQGKTLVGWMAVLAFLRKDPNSTVMVLNAQDQLAARDFADLVDAYEKAGYDRNQIALIDENGKILITTGRDADNKLIFKEVEVDKLNDLRIIYAEATKPAFFILRQMVRGNYSGWDSLHNIKVILDEVDSILVEKMLSPLIISENKGEYYTGSEAEFWTRVGKLARGEYKNGLSDFLSESRARGNNIFEQVESIIPRSIKENLIRDDLYNLVMAIINAQHIFNNMAGHYIIAERNGRRQIIIVSEFSHEPQLGQQWNNFIHQIIEAATGLKVSKVGNTMQTLTMKHFLDRCGYVTGFSGTAYVFSDLFRDIYKGTTITIPKSFTLKQNNFLFAYKGHSSFHWDSMFDAAIQSAQKGHPVVLVVDLKDLDIVYKTLKDRSIAGVNVQKYGPHEWLDMTQRTNIQAKAGQKMTITVTTPILGRGIDIKMEAPLIVIADGLYARWTAEQIIGRAYRGQKAGATFTFTSSGQIYEMSQAQIKWIRETLKRSDISEEQKQILRRQEAELLFASTDLITALNSMNGVMSLDYSDPRIRALQNAYVMQNQIRIQDLLKKYELLIAFETETGPDTPKHYLRPLQERIAADAVQELLNYASYVQGLDADQISRKIEESQLLTAEEKELFLRRKKHIVDRYGKILDIRSILDAKLKNSELKLTILTDFRENLLSSYKRWIFNASSSPQLTVDANLLSEAYDLFRIYVILAILSSY